MKRIILFVIVSLIFSVPVLAGPKGNPITLDDDSKRIITVQSNPAVPNVGAPANYTVGFYTEDKKPVSGVTFSISNLNGKISPISYGSTGKLKKTNAAGLGMCSFACMARGAVDKIKLQVTVTTKEGKTGKYVFDQPVSTQYPFVANDVVAVIATGGFTLTKTDTPTKCIVNVWDSSSGRFGSGDYWHPKDKSGKTDLSFDAVHEVLGGVHCDLGSSTNGAAGSGGCTQSSIQSHAAKVAYSSTDGGRILPTKAMAGTQDSISYFLSGGYSTSGDGKASGKVKLNCSSSVASGELSVKHEFYNAKGMDYGPNIDKKIAGDNRVMIISGITSIGTACAGETSAVLAASSKEGGVTSTVESGFLWVSSVGVTTYCPDPLP